MRIALEIILFIIAVAILIFNFLTGREAYYAASVIIVCATFTLLVRSISNQKRRSRDSLLAAVRIAEFSDGEKQFLSQMSKIGPQRIVAGLFLRM